MCIRDRGRGDRNIDIQYNKKNYSFLEYPETNNPGDASDLQENNLSRNFTTCKFSAQMEDVESCKNLLDQGEYDFDTQKYKHHPVLSIVSELSQAFHRKAGNVMLATSKTNEIIDEKFLQKQYTNNDIKRMFKYELVHRNKNPNQTNLLIVLKISTGTFRTLHEAKKAIFDSYLRPKNYYLMKCPDPDMALATTTVGFLCDINPAQVHVSSLQDQLNATLSAVFESDTDQTFRKIASRYRVDNLTEAPRVQLYRNKSRIFTSKKESVLIDTVQVIVPTALRAMCRTMLRSVAQINPNFEVCDRAYLYSPNLEELYFKQVTWYQKTCKEQFTIRIHGFSVDDMKIVQNDIINTGILRIDQTEKVAQRGMWNLLADQSFPPDGKSRIDDICNNLNREKAIAQFPDTVRSRYRTEDSVQLHKDPYMDNLVKTKYIHVVTPNAWEKPMNRPNVMSSGGSVSTAATTSMDSDRISNLEQTIRDVRLQIKQAIHVSEQGTRRTMSTLTGKVQSAKDDIALVKSETGSRISKVETAVTESNKKIEQNEKKIEESEKKHTKHENDVTEMKEVLNLIYQQMMNTQQQSQQPPPPHAAPPPPAGSMVTNSHSTITNQVISVPRISRFPRPPTSPRIPSHKKRTREREALANTDSDEDDNDDELSTVIDESDEEENNANETETEIETVTSPSSSPVHKRSKPKEPHNDCSSEL